MSSLHDKIRMCILEEKSQRNDVCIHQDFDLRDSLHVLRIEMIPYLKVILKWCATEHKTMCSWNLTQTFCTLRIWILDKMSLSHKTS